MCLKCAHLAVFRVLIELLTPIAYICDNHTQTLGLDWFKKTFLREQFIRIYLSDMHIHDGYEIK